MFAVINYSSVQKYSQVLILMEELLHPNIKGEGSTLLLRVSRFSYESDSVDRQIFKKLHKRRGGHRSLHTSNSAFSPSSFAFASLLSLCCAALSGSATPLHNLNTSTSPLAPGAQKQPLPFRCLTRHRGLPLGMVRGSISNSLQLIVSTKSLFRVFLPIPSRGNKTEYTKST